MATPYLTKRRAGWYLRVRIPADLVSVFGTHLTRSLSTRDHQIARRSAIRVVAALQGLWEEARVSMAFEWRGKSLDEMSAEDFLEMGAERLDTENDRALPEERLRIRKRMAYVLATEEQSLEDERQNLHDLTAAYNEQLVLMVRNKSAMIEGLKEAIKCLPLTSSERPAVGIEGAEKAPNPKGAESWTKFQEEFFKDRPGIGDRARTSHRQAFRDLQIVIGEKPIRDVTTPDIKRFADWLRDKPIDRAGRSQLSRETIVKLLQHVRSFFAWAAGSGIICANPAMGVTPRTETREERDRESARQAFTTEQLKILFNSPLFTGCAGPSHRTKPGAQVYRDERFWFFLVMLFTGARVEELAQAPAKLGYLGEIACLDLRSAGTKTNNSPRVIPILPELSRLGFTAWADKKARGNGKLFHGGAAFKDWSKGTNRYLDIIGLSDHAHATYSLRHNFRQMLNASGISLETADKIFGHGKRSKKSAGAGYGRHLSEAEAHLLTCPRIFIQP